MALSANDLEDVYERRYAGFRGGAAALVGDYDLAHDIVQDGFARALARREHFRGGSPEAWVWRIIERRALDSRRALGRARAVEDDFPAELVVDERDPALASAVANLSPRRRLVVFLRYFADLAYADIARICGIREGTVAATLAQAHDELRAALEREEVQR
jgi:RNA polymerase sigma factor (sigma-70 family)